MHARRTIAALSPLLALLDRTLAAPAVGPLDSRAVDSLDNTVHVRDAEAIDAILAEDSPSLRTDGRAAHASWNLVGVNQCGLEYGLFSIPGRVNADYFVPEMSSINQFFAVGHNTIRLPFLMERLGGIRGDFRNAEYLRELIDLVDGITRQGKFAVLVPLNYGRFHGRVIRDARDFGAFWRALAGRFKTNRHVIFDVMNEWHDESMQLVHDLSQAAIDGIRAAGADSQSIWIEATCWDNAVMWTSCRGTDGASLDILADLRDPSHKIVYSTHVYMDQDDTGHWLADCDPNEPLVGVKHLRGPTAWLRRHGKVGVVGEFGSRATPNCLRATRNALYYAKRNGARYQGVVWWNSGSHTKDQPATIEPGTKGWDMYAKLLATA